VAAYEAKYPGFEGVYLYVRIARALRRQREIHGCGTTRSWIAEIHRAGSEADWLTSFRLGFKPDTCISGNHARRPRADLRKQDLKKEQFASGFDFYTLVYPDVVKGTIIEEGWSDASGRLLSAAGSYIPLQFSIPCERLSFTYACPDWWALKSKKSHPTASPRIQDNDFEHKKQIIKYEGINIPPSRMSRSRRSSGVASISSSYNRAGK